MWHALPDDPRRLRHSVTRDYPAADHAASGYMARTRNNALPNPGVRGRPGAWSPGD
jgi:hypothetical protein